MKKKIGIWVRVSTDKQSDSAQNHEERARMYAQSKGWQIIEIYRLEDVSGKTLMSHPETQRMLSDIASSQISGLIFSKLARLARNTRELLDFADYFKKHEADLISLQEAIDTSSPAGRLFYTIIGAMAQWEREEIADRVSASVAVRAKLGKPLGGRAPYGYSHENGKLVINEKEAAVRRLMFNLFLEHKRMSSVSRILNNKGYRSRKGNLFSDVAIKRHLTDTVAKGIRRMNYSRSITKENVDGIKPMEDWVYHECPAIVSEEIFNAVNAIIEEQSKKSKQPLNKKIHLFTGVLQCNKGHQMYLYSRMEKYSCRSCKLRINKDDLEEVFKSRLKKFVFSEEEINDYLSKSQNSRKQKQQELNHIKAEIASVEEKLDNLLSLHLNKEIPTKGFNKHYIPLHTRLEQLNSSIPMIEKELNEMKNTKSSFGEIIKSSQDLFDRWNSFGHEEKRDVIETITNAIIFDGQNLTFKLKRLSATNSPSSFSELIADGQTND